MNRHGGCASCESNSVISALRQPLTTRGRGGFRTGLPDAGTCPGKPECMSASLQGGLQMNGLAVRWMIILTSDKACLALNWPAIVRQVREVQDPLLPKGPAFRSSQLQDHG